MPVPAPKAPPAEGAPHPASFRDPSGFVFRRDGTLLRQVNRRYAEDYRELMEGGLYEDLRDRGLLVEHEELGPDHALTDAAHTVIRPRELPFLSYPYEWPFGALKSAALLTLDIQLRALEHGMTLKDASVYNVQFEGSRPLFIDTLSFERRASEEPWVAYGQFCRHFLAPLALMARADVRLGRLLSTYLDGVPLDLASGLLSRTTWFRPGLAIHVHLHARMEARYAETTDAPRRSRRSLSTNALRTLIGSLRRTVDGLDWSPGGTEWADYYEDNTYGSDSLETKKRIVGRYLDRVEPRTVWDLGANTGLFSRLAVDAGALVYSLDIDPACVERNFRQARARGDTRLLPLLMDLTNPSPALGWAHREREALGDRGPADLALGLALIHHLCISNNLPLPRVAGYLHGLCRHLVIEWVPKDDPQVRRLLRSREDVFDDYGRHAFEDSFGRWFDIVDRSSTGNGHRVIYLMKSRREDVPGPGSGS